MAIWELTSRLCVNTVVLNVLCGETISKNGPAHDVMFDYKVSHHHVRFDSFLHLTQVFSRTVEVTISNRPRQLPHVNLHNSLRDPKLLKGQRRRIMEGQMGGSPKASATASGRGNQPAGEDPESNICSPTPTPNRVHNVAV